MNKMRIPVIMALAFLLSIPQAQAQTSVALSPVAKQQFFGANGAPLASGCINTYISGTSTPLPTYTDSTGVTQNPNPIILDAGGFASIWLTNSTYRFVLTSTGGVNCATGTLQYTIDGISAYTIINSPQNLFLLGAASDPSGTAGELAYRTDIPCFRGFTTFWDCFVRLTDTQTLTNKTLTAPTITGTVGGSANYTTPQINGTTMQNSPGTYAAITNETITGTSLNHLAKLTVASPATAITPLVSDTGGIIGICVANCTTSGNATIQQSGTVNCAFDGGTTSGDYIVISSTIAGDCHDASNSTFPTSGQVLGRVLSTNGGAGTYSMTLSGQELRGVPVPAVSPVESYTTASASVNTSIGSTPMLITIAAGVTLRFGGYVTQTVLGASCAGSTTIVLNIIFKDPNAAANQTQPLATFTITNNGTLGIVPVTTNTNLPIYVRTAAAQTTSYSTTYTAAGGCAPAPSYQVFPILETF